MCYHLSFLVKKLSDLAIRYNDVLAPNWQAKIDDFHVNIENPNPGQPISTELIEEWQARLDAIELPTYHHVTGMVHPRLPVIVKQGIFLVEWGLIPSWAQAGFNSIHTLNARSEDIFTTPSYRDVIMKRRCIIPVSSFFETRHVHSETGKKKDTLKVPYRIFREHDLLSLAGVWDVWLDPVYGRRATFSIVTTKASPLMAQIHNNPDRQGPRMPLILTEENRNDWLNLNLPKENLKEIMQPYTGVLNAYTVSTDINNYRREPNRPNIVEKVEYPIPPLND
ncbi:SOS response-associated peptidase [Emticicia fluvialis]|uniref:SOS response-associated peptidase n=1 Tax=Emticicia fluvialis TaxID=2974474 RepID=UPI0021665DE8|nr:SOS response-associated peptidase [Emticicia fluvialis]